MEEGIRKTIEKEKQNSSSKRKINVHKFCLNFRLVASRVFAFLCAFCLGLVYRVHVLCCDGLVWVLACRFSCSWVFVQIFSSFICDLLSLGYGLSRRGRYHHWCWCCCRCSCCCCLRPTCPGHQAPAWVVGMPPPRVSKCLSALDCLPWWSEPPCSGLVHVPVTLGAKDVAVFLLGGVQQFLGLLHVVG